MSDERFCKVCGRPLPPRHKIFCPACGKKYHTLYGKIVPRRSTSVSANYRKHRLDIASECGLAITKAQRKALLDLPSDVSFDANLNDMLRAMPFDKKGE